MQKSSLSLAKKQGHAEGVEEGIVKGIELVVLNSYKAGLETEMISQITSLSVDEINKVISKE